MPESFTFNCNCQVIPGTVPPLAPYVVSIEGLQGIVNLGNTGAITWRTEDNTIYADFNASAGLGSVTSVAVASSNSNLVVVSGSPITTIGTITLNLTGNIGSISGLVMAADQMIYSTAANTFAATSLTSFARTLLDDPDAAGAQTTLALVPGTDVQAWSQVLTDFVTNSNYTGADLELGGSLQVGGDITGLTDLSITGNSTLGGTLGITGLVTSTAGFSGPGTSLTALNGTNITSGTVAVTRGGTGLVSYTVGDLIYASSANVLAKLSTVNGSRYLRSTTAGLAPAWSTLNLPNSATTGDIFIGTSSNTMGSLADVAVNNVLLSGGVGVAPAYGKVTLSHTTGIAGSGSNTDITGFSQNLTIGGTVTFNANIAVNADLFDVNTSEGAAGDILRSNGTGFGVEWTNQVTLDSLTINTSLSTEGTITPGGTTGTQTINKPSGTVRIAASGTSVVVNNSLCDTNSRVLACCSTNDSTAIVKNVVTTTGAFTINIVATTAEVEISWLLINLS